MRKSLLSALGCLSLATLMQSNAQVKGPSSSQTPFVLPASPGYQTTSLLTTTDLVGGYKMCGIPDGLGAFDNGDGTFTVLMNHELGNTLGVTRAHGAIGAFVSKWIINKSTLEVMSGSDLIQQVYGWNTATQSNNITPSSIAFNRFCSADLPPVTAFYNASTGLGTQARIFMHGEEGGATGYQLASVASGPNAGKTYVLGKFDLSTNNSGLIGVGAWENALANPFAQDKTIVIGNNDGGTGIMTNALAVYVGNKTSSGTDADKAGLTNGTLKFISVSGNPVEIINNTTRATNITSGTPFTLSANSSTTFSRPEDGAWNPNDPRQYYFVTTDRLDQVADGVGTQIGRSRLWRLNFTDITHPELGGTIDLLLDGTEGQNMFDNIAADHWGHLILQEDVGNAAHNGKIWQYNVATDQLKLIARHDVARFGDLTIPATAPFNQDEETSGVIDVQEILGAGKFLYVDQAHYPIAGDAVEGGQLMLLYNPDTYSACSSYAVTTTLTPSPAVPGQAANTIYLGYGPQSVTITAAVPSGFPPYSFSWSPGGATTASITVNPVTTTTYTVTVTNQFGCRATASQVVEVRDIRDGDKDKVFICHNGHSQSVSVNAVPAHLAHGDQLGNCEEGALTRKEMPMNETFATNKCTVYPNPAANYCYVKTELKNAAQITVSVTDAQGRITMQPSMQYIVSGTQLIRLNTSNLVNGLYFVTLSYGNTQQKLKLVIVH